MKISNYLKLVFNSISDYRNFKKNNKIFLKYVIYSENSSYTHFFEPLIKLFVKNNICLSIVTSDYKDDILKIQNDNIRVFFIENNFVRTIFFKNLKCENLILTMPDLGNLYIKKSALCKNYIYMFHTIVSTNIIYNDNSFQNYDYIFCSAKHHFEELKKKKYSSNLIKIGYSKIDELAKTDIKSIKSANINNILIAPTWGKKNIINTCIEELIDILSNNNFNITLRPHPISITQDTKIISKILLKFKDRSNFKISKSSNNIEDYKNNFLIISDWSGAALEFSLALERPAVFIDMPQKIINKKIKQNSIELKNSFENWVRFELGEVIHYQDISKIIPKIKKIQHDTDHYIEKIQSIKYQYIYNLGKSDEVAFKYLLNI